MAEFLAEVKKKNKRCKNYEISIDRRDAQIEKDDTTEGNSHSTSRKSNRQTYFCIGFLDVWSCPPAHVTIKKLRNKFKLKWLRLSMSYIKFPNVQKLL